MPLACTKLLHRKAPLAALALVLSACGASPPAMASPPVTPVARGADAPSTEIAPATAPAAAPAPQGGASPTAGAKPAGPSASPTPATSQAQGAKKDDASPAAPLLVYVGDLGLTTDEAATSATLDRVVDVAEALGGHLAGRSDTTVKVKVPSKRFRECMSAVEKLAEVTRRSVTADDVTAQFHDLEVRLENLKATRKRLEEFLSRASNVADTLTVERELERVAKEIDGIEGQLRFLRDATSFSVLSVAVTPKPKPKPVEVAVERPKDPPAPPPPRPVSLPIGWLNDVGLATLLDVDKH
jgi:hypothetical protein